MADEPEIPPQEGPLPEAATLVEVAPEREALSDETSKNEFFGEDAMTGDGLEEPGVEAQPPLDLPTTGEEGEQSKEVEGQAREGDEAPRDGEMKQGEDEAIPEGEVETKPEGEEAQEIESTLEGEGSKSKGGTEGEESEGEKGSEEDEGEGVKEWEDEDEDHPPGYIPKQSINLQDLEFDAAVGPGNRMAGSYIDGDFEGGHEDDHDAPDLDFEADEPEEQEYEPQEEEAKEEENEVRVIDRAMYYELHKVYEQQVNEERIKNNFLQRRMTEYFKRRRMMHVLRESMYESDTQVKYERKLDALDQLIDISTRESDRINTEVSEMRKQRDDKKAELAQFFNKMQKREYDIGQDLLNNKGAKYNVEKAVEHYLKRQSTLLNSMIKMRLTYIKIRNKVYEKQAKLIALDNLGDNLHLVDYEQLKTDVRNNSDKFEEKDGELLKIREHCKSSMQVLAHLREKSGAYDADIDMYNDQLEEITREHNDVREQLLYLKQERDNYRTWTNKLRADSGLLTKPVLLRDMEDSLNEVKSATEKLKDTRDQYDTLTEQVAAVRKHIENHREKRLSSTALPIENKASRGSRVSRGALPSRQSLVHRRSSTKSRN